MPCDFLAGLCLSRWQILQRSWHFLSSFSTRFSDHPEKESDIAKLFVFESIWSNCRSFVDPQLVHLPPSFEIASERL